MNSINKIIQRFIKPKTKVAYLLESTDLWGGVKVVFRHVEVLNKIGYNAVVICNQSYPAWLKPGVDFKQHDTYDNNLGLKYDVLIATGFRLPQHHYAHKSKALLIHFCQGYEGDFMEAAPIINQIESAYQLPIPRFAITEKLKVLMEAKFKNNQVFNVGQGLEHEIFHPEPHNINLHYHDDINLFLFGPLEGDIKQIKTGLFAYKKASRLIPQLKLIRVSLFDTQKEEEKLIGSIHEYYANIRPEKVGELFRTKPGLLLAPSKDAEGFGLPAIEAMACGVPTVLTRISSFKSFDKDHDYAEFADVGNSTEMANAIKEIIFNHNKRHHIIQRGLEVVQKFNYQTVAEKLDIALINCLKQNGD